MKTRNLSEWWLYSSGGREGRGGFGPESPKCRIIQQKKDESPSGVFLQPVRYAIGDNVAATLQVNQHVPDVARAESVRRKGATGVPCSAAFEARFRRSQ